MNESTKKNLDRKSQHVDNVQLHNGKPLFSWIDLNPTELCNRTCVFCPRADDNKYPNQALHISDVLIDKMVVELKELNYEGSIVLSGFGEPMLYPSMLSLISKFKGIKLEIVTNGDPLTVKNTKEMYDAGLSMFVISMYDGPEQIERFKKMFDEAGISEEHYMLRDRWHTDEDAYGLKLTNRAGMVDVGIQEEIRLDKPCYYPQYSMTVDWNGDVLLCVQDWNKKVKLGNIHAQTLLEVWNSSAMNKYRKTLGSGNRNISPCNGCNTDGTLHGFNHIKSWKEV